MTVIDKILTEWSFRCHDGIVDMNNPLKVSILKEIMIEEGIDDDIMDAILNLPEDDPKKQKVLNYLQGSEDEKDKEIERLTKLLDGSKQEKEKKSKEIKNIINILTNKKLSKSTIYLIIFEFINNDKEDELISYFKENNTPELDVTQDKNIKTKPASKLPEDIIDSLYDELSGTKGTKGVGKEENFLVAFYKNITKLEGKGDIKIDNQQYEVKGVSSMVTPSNITRGSKKSVIDLLITSFFEGPNKLNQYIDPEKFKKREKWTSTISSIYNTYQDKEEFRNKLQNILSIKYPNLEIGDEDLKNPTNFIKKIAKNLVSNTELNPGEKILFVSEDGYIKIYNDQDDLEKAIDNDNIKIDAFSDFVPRLVYEPPKEKKEVQIEKKYFFPGETGENIYISHKWINNINNKAFKNQFDTTPLTSNKPSSSEYYPYYKLKPDSNIKIKQIEDKILEENQILIKKLTNYLTELFGTEHYDLRKKERSKILDILNLNKIPLKDYKSSEVKEKLISSIEDELNKRLSTLEGKDITAPTYYLGLKIIKPILVVDGKEYNLNLYTQSTKEIKDKNGKVVETKLVDNEGTYYLAIIKDDSIITLILLTKEDDIDIHWQIVNHVDRKKDEKTDTKILTGLDFEYKIDIDELFGKEKEKPQETLIDPLTLPYKVRTDYRVGANFDHEKFGTGKIVATSAGSGGKGDSRGVVDWVDVKYPKPFLKGGKLTDIRRFEIIYTLASPLLAK